MILFLMGFLAGGIAGFFLAALMAAAAREAPKVYDASDVTWTSVDISQVWDEWDKGDA